MDYPKPNVGSQAGFSVEKMKWRCSGWTPVVIQILWNEIPVPIGSMGLVCIYVYIYIIPTFA